VSDTTLVNRNCTIRYNKASNNSGLSGAGNGQITLTAYTGNPEAMTGLTNLNVSNNVIYVNKTNTVALSATVNINGTWSGNSFTNNNIILSTAVTGTKVYNLGTNANIATANYNNIYSSMNPYLLFL